MNRQARLRGRQAFARVRAGRRAGQSGPVRVNVAASDHGRPRVGFAIPRAVGGAVVRNRLRRRLRAILAPRLDALGGVDLVVTLSPAAAGLDHPSLASHVVAAVHRALARLSAGAAPVAANGRPGPDEPSAARSTMMAGVSP